MVSTGIAGTGDRLEITHWDQSSCNTLGSLIGSSSNTPSQTSTWQRDLCCNVAMVSTDIAGTGDRLERTHWGQSSCNTLGSLIGSSSNTPSHTSTLQRDLICNVAMVSTGIAGTGDKLERTHWDQSSCNTLGSLIGSSSNTPFHTSTRQRDLCCNVAMVSTDIAGTGDRLENSLSCNTLGSLIGSSSNTPSDTSTRQRDLCCNVAMVSTDIAGIGDRLENSLSSGP